MKYYYVFTLCLFAGFVLSSCTNEIKTPPEEAFPFYRDTVITFDLNARSGSVSPVEKNFSITHPSNEIRLSMHHEIATDGVIYSYEYIGKGTKDDLSIIDIYLLYIKMGDQEEYIPVLYSGGKQVLVDKPGISVTFHQEADNA